MTTTSNAQNGVTPAIDRLRASGPGEILQAVPYLLGFQPARSVVLIGLSPPRGRVRVTARFDLDAPLDVAEPWFDAAAGAGADRFIVAVYDDAIAGRPLPHRDSVDAWTAMGDRRDMSVVDALAVNETRWWSYSCDNGNCCPADGQELVVAGAVAAAAVSYGLVAAPSRSMLEAEVAENPDLVEEVEDLLDALDQQELGRAMGAPGYGSSRGRRADAVASIERLMADCIVGNRPCTAPEAVDVLLPLCDVVVRDAMIATVPVEGDPQVLQFWRDLCCCAPDMLAAAPATLYAMTAFAEGDGARANIGIERALVARPDYRMAQLLDHGIWYGLPPSKLIASLVEDARKQRARIVRRGKRAARTKPRR